ncbi:MAG: Hsp20/alpha crystallin family protein [bacterium]|nr:Hsp20/alpha crystallin family protein [bacterium]
MTPYRPKTDLVQTAEGYELWMDLPGVPKENLSIEVAQNRLIVVGQPKPREGQPVHAEYGVGPFERSFRLGETISKEEIQAELKNGVLKLRLPKSQAALPVEITVH